MADYAVQRIDALCACEGCGKRFGVELDIGEPLKGGSYDDFDDMVRWYVRGGNVNCYTWGVRGKSTVDRLSLSCHPTVQADLLLCDICTKKCDDVEVPEDRNLTRAEVNKALGLIGADDD
jgi:hypothetical protein